MDALISVRTEAGGYGTKETEQISFNKSIVSLSGVPDLGAYGVRRLRHLSFNQSIVSLSHCLTFSAVRPPVVFCP